MTVRGFPTSMRWPLSIHPPDQFSMLGFSLDPKRTKRPPRHPAADPGGRSSQGMMYVSPKYILRGLPIAYPAPTPPLGLVDQPRKKNTPFFSIFTSTGEFSARFPSVPGGVGSACSSTDLFIYQVGVAAAQCSTCSLGR